MSELTDYETAFKVAVGEFWGIRDDQIRRQLESGNVDAGSRGAVTGGGHLKPIEDLVQQVLTDVGVPASCVHRGRQRGTRLPGWFRELKNWDLVVLDRDQVVLTVECKSQVGSFGNNLNNRIEEAIGQTYDYWKASEEVFSGLRPWFGYVMLVEDSPASTGPVRTQPSVVRPDATFINRSYVDRYAIAFDRLYKERLLDAVVFAHAEKGSALPTYPEAAMSFGHFAVALQNRVAEYRAAASPLW